MKLSWVKTVPTLLVALLLALSLFGFYTPPTPVSADGTVIDAPCDDNNFFNAVFNADPGSTLAFTADCSMDFYAGLGIQKDLTIDGNGYRVEISPATQWNAVFGIGDNSTTDLKVTLRGLILSNGYMAGASGGAISMYKGHLFLDHDTFSNNHPDSGGAIVNYFGDITITDSIFAGNQAIGTHDANGNGGAIYSYGGALNIDRTTFTYNTASGLSAMTAFGGAIYTGSTTTITNSTFSNNSAQVGGAIFSANAPLTITNSTFAGNLVSDRGSAVSVYENTAAITNSTIANNIGSGGLLGAVHAWSDNLPAVITLRNTILSGNGGFNCGVTVTGSGSAAILSDGGNISYPDTDMSCLGDYNQTDPGLSELANHGGPTQTMAIIDPASAAIHLGTANCPAADQRGVARANPPAVCDSGAYEAITRTTLSSTPDNPTMYGDTLIFTAAVSPNPGAGTLHFMNGAQPLGSATVNGSGVASLTTTLVNAGSNAVTAVFQGTPGYPASTSDPDHRTVTQAPLTILADSAAKTYGETDPAFDYVVSSGELFNGDTLGGALGRASGEDAGDYAINLGALTAGPNYSISVDATGAKLTIDRLHETVTANPQSKTYGEADPFLDYSYDLPLPFGDRFTGTLAREAGEDVGTYAIRRGDLALSSNYVVTFTGADLEIGLRTIRVTADTLGKVYGGSEPALTYTITRGSLAFSDQFTGALARDPGDDVGDYAITQGDLALSSNYTLTFIPGSLHITPLYVTVTVDFQAKDYGSLDPALTYAFHPALVPGDSFSGALARDPGEGAGDHLITQGDLALDSNYTLVFLSAYLRVYPLDVAVTADSLTKVYGGTDPALSYKVTPALIHGDSFSGALARDPGETVADYAITQGDLALSSNYELTFTPASLSITPLPVTVTANGQAKTYGGADPALTYAVAPALVSGDNFSGALARDPGTDAGDYAIRQGSLALNGNYTLTYKAASFSIRPLIVTITVAPQTKVYGDPDPVFAYTANPALLAGDQFDGALTRDPGEGVGFYAIVQGQLTAGANYTLNLVNANLTITKATLTFTVDNATRIFGSDNPAFTCEVKGFRLSDGAALLVGKPALASLATPTSRPGVYAITLSAGSLQPMANYDFVFVDGAMTIQGWAVYLPAVRIK